MEIGKKIIMVSVQEWLDKKYPQEKRKNIKKLDISKKNLEGKLNIKGFSELTELDCSHNRITQLTISES